MELGADAVELDVHRTADGEIVVHHDPVIARPGAPGIRIAEAPLADVREARVRGEPVPTLREVLDLLRGTLVAYCELKGAGTARGTLACLEETGARGAVHSFDHREVLHALALAPGVPRGVLEASYPIRSLEALHSVDARDLWRHRDHVDEALIKAVHADGRRVIAWTVNDAAAMERFAGWGIDGLCTDDVELARSVLA
jgi:glycerophosphoryl diester phosphodiesterase